MGFAMPPGNLLGLRAERPAHRYGVVVLAALAGVLLIAVNAVTARLIPLYAIGVFTGFTTGDGSRTVRCRQAAW